MARKYSCSLESKINNKHFNFFKKIYAFHKTPRQAQKRPEFFSPLLPESRVKCHLLSFQNIFYFVYLPNLNSKLWLGERLCPRFANRIWECVSNGFEIESWNIDTWRFLRGVLNLLILELLKRITQYPKKSCGDTYNPNVTWDLADKLCTSRRKSINDNNTNASGLKFMSIL